jgi:hypothetical protein
LNRQNDHVVLFAKKIRLLNGYFTIAFFADAFLAATFLTAGFFAAGFLVTAFLAAGFLAAGFLAVVFLAAGFFAAGFFATVFFTAGFFAAGFLGAVFLAVVLVFAVAMAPPLIYKFKDSLPHLCEELCAPPQTSYYSGLIVNNIQYMVCQVFFQIYSKLCEQFDLCDFAELSDLS